MEVSPKEMRKMLNAAWDAGDEWRKIDLELYYRPTRPDRRYRDVSRILEAKMKEQRKDGRDD